MGEKFNNEIEKIKEIKTYSKRKQVLCDDMASAFLTAYADNECSLDQGLIRIKSTRKALMAIGSYSIDQINDFIVEQSYISKSTLRKMFNQSIYNDDDTIRNDIETIPAHFSGQCTTDLIIDELKNRPALLNDLKNGMRADNIQRKHKINNTTLLKNFYDANKDIINM